ncbi:MAG: histidine--tRNA ligase [Candidatus Roizmanbacteria bacterium]
MLQTLKGFRDFIGINARQRAWLIAQFRQIFEANGFEPLETPALEYEELLLGKYGEEANKLIYGFEDRGGRRIALRYDQTVPTARVISQYRNELTFPYKRYQIQPVWRADKPQKGRYREFTQCDIDIVGAKSPMADAQILATVAQFFDQIGVDYELRVNNRTALIEMITGAGIGKELIFSVIQTIDKLDKKTSDEVVAELREKGVTQQQADILFQNFKSSAPSANLQSILDIAGSLGVKKSKMVFTPTLARGLDYYTGMIFEIILPAYGGGSVGGGGRYDNLINDLVGFDSPAVGMAFGFDRLIDALTDMKAFPSNLMTDAQVLVTIFSPDQMNYSAQIARGLRGAGVNVDLYADSTRKLEAQLKYALAKSIPYLIIAGPDEEAGKVIQLKNLSERSQKTLSIEEVIEKLKSA